MKSCLGQANRWIFRFGGVILAFIALGAPLGAQGTSVDNPTGKIVAQVIPVDIQSIDPEYIRSLMSTRAGKPYDDTTINEDVRRLLNSKLFVPGSVSVSTAIGADGRVTVFVKAKELSGRIQEIRYIGAQHYSQDELHELTGIRRGGPMNPTMNELARTAILNKLREDGRFYASVELVEGKKASDSNVIFQIVEGPIIRVKRIDFRGNVAASSGRLRTVVASSSSIIPGAVTPLSPKLNPMSIDEDKKRLITYYHRLGHIDAMVAEEIVPDVNDISAVTILYHITEGSAYTVRKVYIDGNKSLPETRIRQVTGIKPGDRFDIDAVTADEKRIEMLIGNAGYRTFVNTERFVARDQPGVVDIHYHIVEQNREPDRVGRIIIEGNTVTDQRVILNQLGLYPGQVLQRPQLERARLNLMRTGLFDMEDPPIVEEIPSEFDSNYKDIRVRVKEGQTGLIALQANVNSDLGLNGNLVYNQRNFDLLRVPTSLDDLFAGKAFTGGGQEFRAEASPGVIFQRYAVAWREPYLFDSRYGLSVSGSYFTRQLPEFNEERVGVRVGVDYRFDDNNIWRANFMTRLEGVTVDGIPYWASPAITDDRGFSTVLGLRAGITRDTRDNILMPMSGSIVDVAFEQVLGDYDFPIGVLEASKYFTVWERKDGSGKHVLATRTQVTFMGSNAPVFERVFAGGIRSFRGFTFRGMGPFENNLAVGGTFAWLNNMEYLVPVLANDKLYFAAFVDHGTVEQSAKINDYRVTVGVGLRIAVPQLGPLPIALDFGFPVVRKNTDNREIFQFSMGWGFGQ